jgi:predicted DNA-binding transcriptional regulator AlpA
MTVTIIAPPSEVGRGLSDPAWLAAFEVQRAQGRYQGLVGPVKLTGEAIEGAAEFPSAQAANLSTAISTPRSTNVGRRVAKRFEIPPPGQKTGPAYPPRAMRAEQAADYLSMSRSMWLKLVDEGKMPKPIKIGAMTTWDRYDIDDAFEDLKRGNGEPSENTVHKRLRELADERRKKGRTD